MNTRRPIDKLTRFTFDNTPVRGEIVQLSDSLGEALEKHDYPQPVQRLIGEFMAAASLLSATLKFEGSLILQVSGKGPVPMLMAECRDQALLRAIASYQDSIQDHTTLLADGRLAITIEPDQGERYQSIIVLEGDDLSNALERYFLQSEQLRTRIWLASDGQRAGGLMLQALPQSADQSSLSIQSEDWERLELLSDTLTTDELLGLESETILHRLYNQETVRVYPPSNLEFSCSCSRERSTNSLLSIGETEARIALATSGTEIHVDCQFCNARYVFTEDNLNQLFGTQVH